MHENNIVANSLTNSNKKRVSNFNELIAFIKKYQELCKKYESLSKEEKILINEEFNDIKSILRRGIKIDNKIILQYIESIKSFIDSFEIDSNLIAPKLNSMELTISPVNLLENGKLCNYGSFIAIDYSYINFDENGNFLNFNEPMPGFFNHTIIHELLHSISNKGINFMDSFSEGMTEYFAHKISKNTDVFSDKYGYIERIFYLIGTMMGDDLLFQDYVTNIYEMKNLHKFTTSLGINEEEFKAFKSDLDTFLEKSFQEDKSQELIPLKNKIDNFIFSRIVMPYCSYDKTTATEMMMQCFSDSEEAKSDLCEIHFNSNDKKIRN